MKRRRSTTKDNFATQVELRSILSLRLVCFIFRCQSGSSVQSYIRRGALLREIIRSKVHLGGKVESAYYCATSNFLNRYLSDPQDQDKAKSNISTSVKCSF
jgi:hypothetical protein